ncbi:hypothetical protein ABW21_db0206598 [Orbilia brochopaga]|nr:hypothetical protein ABW21_db0206598 [Drechslerella brochopaga]
MDRSGPFVFEFPIRRPSRQNAFVSPKEAVENSPAVLTSTAGESNKDAGLPPILLLPAEVHHIIASYCPLPSDAISLSRTCCRLYKSVGPSNSLLWYNFRYGRTARLEENNIPDFSRDGDYYEECLAVMCNREPKSGCQRCLAYDYRMYNTSKWDKNDDRTSDLVEIYVAKIFHGTWCYKCTREMFDSVTLVQQTTPLPDIPSVLLTEIREVSGGSKKPGYFVSRSAIAKAIEEQCPDGRYTNFYVHRYPQLESDIREAKPYIMQKIVEIYKTQYKHLHLLYSSSQLAKDLKTCLQINQPPVRHRTLSQDAFLDAIFEVGSRYLAARDMAEETREKERLDACKHFLAIFFGQPSEDDGHRMWMPTTIFLARIAQDYWLARWRDVPEGVSVIKPSWLRPGVEDGPKRRCRFCSAPEGPEEENGTKAPPVRYSPILMTFHMIYEHPDMLKEEWHPLRIREPTDLENIKETDAAAEDWEDSWQPQSPTLEVTETAEAATTLDLNETSEPTEKPEIQNEDSEAKTTGTTGDVDTKDVSDLKEVTTALANLRLHFEQASA